MPVRAKFRCESKTIEPGCDGVSVRFEAVYGDGEANKQWSKWTPSGTLTMQITNPSASEQFEAGKEYFLDFTPAE